MVLLKRFFAILLFFNLSFFSNYASLASSRSPTFSTEEIKIGEKTIKVEIADSYKEHEYGLMNRTYLPENSGMLFVFDDERIRYFWMKNTLIDLAIAYIDKDLVIVDIQEMKSTKPTDTYQPSYPSAKPAKYALEMNKGWFSKNKIKVGDRLQRPQKKSN